MKATFIVVLLIVVGTSAYTSSKDKPKIYQTGKLIDFTAE
jgi:hypothetical protein